MVDAGLHDLLDVKDESARSLIAGRVGQCLSIDDLPIAERRAAEALARELVCDAIERVRSELARAVRHATDLPRDIALKIAHDVDSIACPFLDVTDVFSESEWQKLVLTISRGARIAVARRSSLSEGLALALAQFGDSTVAQALVENPAAPTTEPVCNMLIDRFASVVEVLDKLAMRDGLCEAIAAKLIAKVSVAAREKLSTSYQRPEHTEPIAAEAAFAGVLQLIRETPGAGLPALAQALMDDQQAHSRSVADGAS